MSRTPIQQYLADAARTEAPVTPELIERISDPFMIRLQHGNMGLETEVGEFGDSLKRHIFYGKPYDRVNAKEEIGDVMWYIALLANALEVDLQEILDINIAKLKARYPQKFTETDALVRDLAAERVVLETPLAQGGEASARSTEKLSAATTYQVNPLKAITDMPPGSRCQIDAYTIIPPGRYSVSGTSASRSVYEGHARFVDSDGMVWLRADKASSSQVGKLNSNSYIGTVFTRLD